MNFADLIYKLHEFYFTDLWHFCGLILIILAIRGSITRGLGKVGNFFSSIKHRYIRITTRDNLAEKVKTHVPRDVQKFAMIDKTETEK
jgi:hypothetical protein